MEANRYTPYTRFGEGPKQYAKLTVTAVIGTAVDETSIEAVKPYVDNLVYGNSGPAPAALVLEILDNLEENGQQLCGSRVRTDYIDGLIKRSTRIVLVAQWGRTIEAFAILFEGRDHVEITVVCSSAKSKLKRAGSALMKVVAQYAKALDKEEVFLESIPDRKSYYEQFGFRQSAMEDDGLIPMSADVDTLLSGAEGGARRKTLRRRRARRKTRKC